PPGLGMHLGGPDEQEGGCDDCRTAGYFHRFSPGKACTGIVLPRALPTPARPKAWWAGTACRGGSGSGDPCGREMLTAGPGPGYATPPGVLVACSEVVDGGVQGGLAIRAAPLGGRGLQAGPCTGPGRKGGWASALPQGPHRTGPPRSV